MENRKINNNVKNLFKSNGALLQKIADKRKRNFGTVYRWFNSDSDELFHIDVIEILKTESGLTADQIIESDTVNA